jgi:hypothetical protein
MSTTPQSWVATIDTPDPAILSPLRLIPGLEIAPLPPFLWLRGPDWNDTLALACRKIPGLRRYTLLDGKRLVPEARRVPTGFLPELRWQPLRESLPVALPTPHESHSSQSSHAPLTLVRSATIQPANALLTTWSAWHSFATTTAELRLQSLRFATAHDSRVYIEGTPVPTLPGQRFHQRHGIAVPCGWTWSPALETAVLRRWLSLAEGDTAIASPDGPWEIIKAEQFIPATRHAVRLTAEVLAS